MKKKSTQLISIIVMMVVCLILLSSKEKQQEPQQQAPEKSVGDSLTGDFVGGWWSDPSTERTYVNIPASVRLSKGDSTNSWIGEFFFTKAFQSCCNSGSNDGSLSFVMADSIITDFKLLDIIPNCNGTFVGEGLIDKSGTIVIHFTGSDCEGIHKGGRMEFTKKK